MARRPARRRRLPPHERLDELVRAASAVFSHTSFERAQMADVAREMGASPGTLYNYVEGKDALLALVLRRALDDQAPDTSVLPVPAPPLQETIAWLRQRLDWVTDFPVLEAALRRRRAPDIAAEVGAVVLELYNVLVRVRPVVGLMEHSAGDIPELGELFLEVRRELFARMARYVELRGRGHQLRALPDLALASRLVVEATFWAAHRRPADPQPVPVEESLVRESVRALAVHALVADR
jgi:AcrR family transcriptional regulator